MAAETGSFDDARLWRRLGLMVVIAVTLLYGFPMLWMVATSLKPSTELAETSIIPADPTLAAYQDFFATAFLPAFRNSLIISGSTTALCLVLALPAAFALGRTRSRLVTPLLTLLLVVQLIPTSATFIPMFRLLAQLHLIDNLFGVALAQCSLFVPFAVLILRPAFMSIPREIEEAAALDRASTLQFLWHMAIPLTRNATAVTAAIVLAASWGELVYALTFLLDQDKYPLSVFIAMSVGRFSNTWNLLMSVAVMASLPVLLVVMLAQKKLQSGLALGAVK